MRGKLVSPRNMRWVFEVVTLFENRLQYVAVLPCLFGVQPDTSGNVRRGQVRH
jgi:hypothetical protein